MKVPDHQTVYSLRESMKRLLGIEPKGIIPKPMGEFWLEFEARDKAEKNLQLHGRRLAASKQPINVQIVQQQMSVQDIYQFVEDKLIIRDKQDMLHSLREFPTPKAKVVKTVQQSNTLGKGQEKANSNPGGSPRSAGQGTLNLAGKDGQTPPVKGGEREVPPFPMGTGLICVFSASNQAILSRNCP